MQFVRAGQRAGRPVLHTIEGFVVPLLAWTSESSSTPPPSVIPRLALVATRTGDPDAADLAIRDERARAALRKLAAAALRDIGGLGSLDIGERFGYAEAEAERSARRVAKEGRQLWCRLGAWPWWGRNQASLGSEWWLEDSLTEQLFTWAWPSAETQRARRRAA